MNTNVFFSILAIVVAGGIVYVFGHKRRNNKAQSLNLNPEFVDILEMGDIVAYFKSLLLDKNLHKPFIMKDSQEIKHIVNLPLAVTNKNQILIGVYDNNKEMISYPKLICYNELSSSVAEVLGTDKIVVLS